MYLLISWLHIDRGTNHFSSFAAGPEIAFHFAVWNKNNMLIEWGTGPFPTRMITVLASLAPQLHARWGFARALTWLTLYYFSVKNLGVLRPVLFVMF